MRPDTDASGLFTRLVEKIEAMPDEDFPPERPKALLLESIRSFLNDAQALVELEEAGTFDFFDPEKLEACSTRRAGRSCGPSPPSAIPPRATSSSAQAEGSPWLKP